jgi:pentatricopeptide repeat protein
MVLREVIKVYCLAGNEERAVDLLTKMYEKYGVKPTVNCFSKLIYYYSLKGGEIRIRVRVRVLGLV